MDWYKASLSQERKVLSLNIEKVSAPLHLEWKMVPQERNLIADDSDCHSAFGDFRRHTFWECSALVG